MCPCETANSCFETLGVKAARQHLKVVIAFDEHRIQLWQDFVEFVKGVS